MVSGWTPPQATKESSAVVCHSGTAVKPTARLRVSSAMAAVTDTKQRREQCKAMALYGDTCKTSDSEVDTLPTKRHKSRGDNPRVGRSRGARRKRHGTDSISSLSEVPRCTNVATPESSGASHKLDLSQDLSWERDLGSAMDQVDQEERQGHAILPSGFHPTPHTPPLALWLQGRDKPSLVVCNNGKTI